MFVCSEVLYVSPVKALFRSLYLCILVCSYGFVFELGMLVYCRRRAPCKSVFGKGPTSLKN